MYVPVYKKLYLKKREGKRHRSVFSESVFIL